MLISDKTRNVELTNVEDNTRQLILNEQNILEEIFFSDNILIVKMQLDIRKRNEVERAKDFFNKYKTCLPSFVERLEGEIEYGF